METHHLSEAVAEAKGEAFRLREFALQRQDEAIARARHICGRLVCRFARISENCLFEFIMSMLGRSRS